MMKQQGKGPCQCKYIGFVLIELHYSSPLNSPHANDDHYSIVIKLHVMVIIVIPRAPLELHMLFRSLGLYVHPDREASTISKGGSP